MVEHLRKDIGIARIVIGDICTWSGLQGIIFIFNLDCKWYIQSYDRFLVFVLLSKKEQHAYTHHWVPPWAIWSVSLAQDNSFDRATAPLDRLSHSVADIASKPIIALAISVTVRVSSA